MLPRLNKMMESEMEGVYLYGNVGTYIFAVTTYA